jgi:aspartate carbamoyltransferase catalytic subunit
MTSERLKRAKKDLLILAPGPINRGVEVSAEVADCPQSLILGQVANGLAVRMAVLWLTCGPRHAGGRPAGDGLSPATRMS